MKYLCPQPPKATHLRYKSVSCAILTVPTIQLRKSIVYSLMRAHSS